METNDTSTVSPRFTVTSPSSSVTSATGRRPTVLALTSSVTYSSPTRTTRAFTVSPWLNPLRKPLNCWSSRAAKPAIEEFLSICFLSFL